MKPEPTRKRMSEAPPPEAMMDSQGSVRSQSRSEREDDSSDGAEPWRKISKSTGRSQTDKSEMSNALSQSTVESAPSGMMGFRESLGKRPKNARDIWMNCGGLCLLILALCGCSCGGSRLGGGNRDRMSTVRERDEGDSDEGEDDPWKAKSPTMVSVLDLSAMAKLRNQVDDDLGIPEYPAPWPRGLRLQRITGILWFRRKVNLKRLRNEREKSKYPSLQRWTNSLRFEVVIGLLVVLNSLNVGIDGMYKVNEKPPSFVATFEYVFAIIFVLEWTARVLGNSWVWIVDKPMNIFDTFIVWGPGVLSTFVLAPLGVEAGVVRRLNALRVLRLARIIRAIRIIPVFKELWVLVDGVLSCFNLILWAGIILAVVIYIFAVFILETLTKSVVFEDDPVVKEYFGTLPDAMFTLFQIMTFDRWNVIVREIVERQPIAAFLFMFYIGVTGIVLFNLMTAIVVSNTIMEKPKKDEEAMARMKAIEHQNMELKLLKVFDDLDADGSGTLSAEEFQDVLQDVNFARTMKLCDIDLEELPDVFDILDDGSGQLTVENFVNGIIRLQGVAMARDLMKSSRRMTVCSDNALVLKDELKNGSVEGLDRVENDLEVMHEDFCKMQSLVTKHIDLLNQIGLRRIIRNTMPELPSVEEPTPLEAKVADRKGDRVGDIPGGGAAGAGEAKSRDLGGLGDQLKSGQMRAIPSTFILKRRTEMAHKKKQEEEDKAKRAEERKRQLQLLSQGAPDSGSADDAAQAQREEDEEHARAQAESHSAIHREFRHVWRGCGLEVPDANLNPGVNRNFALAPPPVPSPLLQGGGGASAALRALSRSIGPVNLPNTLAEPAPRSPTPLLPPPPPAKEVDSEDEEEKPPEPSPGSPSPLDLRALATSEAFVAPAQPAGEVVRNAVPELQPRRFF